MRLVVSTREPLRTISPLGKLMLALEIVATYARARWWLRWADITETAARARLGAAREDPPPPAGEAEAATQSAREEALLGLRLGIVIQRVFRLLPGDTRCLTRSVVLMRLLARRDVETTLIIGVRTAPSFGAHAWIEHRGKPLLEPIEPGGQRLVEL
jgi:hypothetical protein